MLCAGCNYLWRGVVCDQAAPKVDPHEGAEHSGAWLEYYVAASSLLHRAHTRLRAETTLRKPTSKHFLTCLLHTHTGIASMPCRHTSTVHTTIQQYALSTCYLETKYFLHNTHTILPSSISISVSLASTSRSSPLLRRNDAAAGDTSWAGRLDHVNCFIYNARNLYCAQDHVLRAMECVCSDACYSQVRATDTRISKIN